MRYLSQVLQPFISIPKNAKIKNTEITCKSQKLLLECGLIRPSSSGLFTLLPLARRALNKLERVIATCIESVGAQQISLPALSAASLWEKTGRLDAPAELLTVSDRHGKKYLLAPTHEESIADLLADIGPLSYKQLPLLLYQISNKYRDEHRPKHGLLRAREFPMLDAYGAHASEECALAMYDKVTQAYRRLFDVLELPVYQVGAPSGSMGGTVSHEWQLCAAAGEDVMYVCTTCHNRTVIQTDKCTCGGVMERKTCIEVGHTFILGTKYSDPLKAHFITTEGKSDPLVMSCYGIGITRLLAASLEVLSTETALRWPRAIAPYSTIVIGPKEGSKEWYTHGPDKLKLVCERLMTRDDVILDDRHHLTIGKRMMMADKMGYPAVVVCGRSVTESPPRYELHRPGDEPKMVTLDELGTIGDSGEKLIQCNN